MIEGLEFFGYGFFFVIILLIQMFFPFFFIYSIFKIIFQAMKRISNQKYFKNNIVYYKDSNSNSSKYKNNYIDVSKSKLAKFNTDDINLLKDYFYDIFYRFEVAYNNLDYNIMKMLSTKELYENYYTGISLNLKVGKKKILDKIEPKKVIIYELDSTSMKQIASVMIEISYITYTLDKNGYIISGNRDNRVTEKFEVQFRKDFNREAITHCPNCGATITGNRCEYCRSRVKDEVFKISSIKKIIE